MRSYALPLSTGCVQNARTLLAPLSNSISAALVEVYRRYRRYHRQELYHDLLSPMTVMVSISFAFYGAYRRSPFPRWNISRSPMLCSLRPYPAAIVRLGNCSDSIWERIEKMVRGDLPGCQRIPGFAGAWRSMVITRVTPAAVSIFATSLEAIETRGFVFWSDLANPK